VAVLTAEKLYETSCSQPLLQFKLLKLLSIQQELKGESANVISEHMSAVMKVAVTLLRPF